MKELSQRELKATGLKEENVLFVSSRFPPNLCNVSTTQSPSDGSDASEN